MTQPDTPRYAPMNDHRKISSTLLRAIQCAHTINALIR